MTTLTFQNVKHILAASLLSLGLVACDKGTQSTEKQQIPHKLCRVLNRSKEWRGTNWRI